MEEGGVKGGSCSAAAVEGEGRPWREEEPGQMLWRKRGLGGEGCEEAWLNLLKKRFRSLALCTPPPSMLVLAWCPVMLRTPSQTSLMLLFLSFCSTFLLYESLASFRQRLTSLCAAFISSLSLVLKAFFFLLRTSRRPVLSTVCCLDDTEPSWWGRPRLHRS